MELPETWIGGLLVLDAIRGNRIVRNILQVGVTEIQECVKKGRGDAMNQRMFVLLDPMKLFEQFSVMKNELTVVVEDVNDELAQPLRRNDRRVAIAQRVDENLTKTCSTSIRRDDFEMGLPALDFPGREGKSSRLR